MAASPPSAERNVTGVPTRVRRSSKFQSPISCSRILAQRSTPLPTSEAQHTITKRGDGRHFHLECERDKRRRPRSVKYENPKLLQPEGPEERPVRKKRANDTQPGRRTSLPPSDYRTKCARRLSSANPRATRLLITLKNDIEREKTRLGKTQSPPKLPSLAAACVPASCPSRPASSPAAPTFSCVPRRIPTTTTTTKADSSEMSRFESPRPGPGRRRTSRFSPSPPLPAAAPAPAPLLCALSSPSPSPQARSPARSCPASLVLAGRYIRSNVLPRFPPTVSSAKARYRTPSTPFNAFVPSPSRKLVLRAAFDLFRFAHWSRMGGGKRKHMAPSILSFFTFTRLALDDELRVGLESGRAREEGSKNWIE
ncbi:hypothetical protein MPTK1_5g02780 [Marchantia polymorpha subsp. ruderalis]|uniref:Uncharacterized protein n=2 Tax=Marchantia polymorpha TaxID=3197 RepID=A0AAF6BEB1_MARPO|nr:hypothetical protein MARPO_0124s0045 [Marchantia polymorpha]BBN10345.1 hypothetical protein Mp_5g02780 [Marchantia polymorpha subsp. ruderalis]|eukprot:PTQ30473.1 hypothetical protein MARPO_0124s0045 [Marchantia polymorpha]